MWLHVMPTRPHLPTNLLSAGKIQQETSDVALKPSWRPVKPVKCDAAHSEALKSEASEITEISKTSQLNMQNQ